MALLLVGLVGCGGGGDHIQVAVVWSGEELEQFRQVVEVYERNERVDVDLVSAGDDIDSFLRAQHADDRPDVALLSHRRPVAGGDPGEVLEACKHWRAAETICDDAGDTVGASAAAGRLKEC